MSQSYDELNKYGDADLGLFINNYDEAVLEKDGFFKTDKSIKRNYS